MMLRHMRLAWRLLGREPVYSAVAIGGLAVALAACFLLGSLVRYAWTYNGAIAGSDGIYVVKERRNLLPRPDWNEDGPAPLADAALSAGLAREATGARRFTLGVRADGGARPPVKVDLAVVAPNYLRFFGLHAVAGDADAALARPDALVLSRAEALHLFGRADALGRTLVIDGAPFVVRAVIADLPANTGIDAGILLGQGRHSWDDPSARPGQAWFARVGTYLRPAPGIDARRLEQALEDIVATRRDDPFLTAGLKAGRPRPWTSIAVTRLSDVYFDPDLLASRGGARYGSPAAIAGLASLALLILLLAATNYVNLAAVRTAARRREIGLRKVLGVSGGGLLAQFLCESLLVGAAATALGAVLGWLVLPLFSELVGRPLHDAAGPLGWSMLAVAGLGTGLAAGAYPAWLAARVQASSALSGRSGETIEGYRLRRVLTVAQFAAAIGLIAASLVVWWQAGYASRLDPGFDPRPQLVLQLPGAPESSAAHAFKAALAHLPGVEGITAMSEAVGRDGVKIVRMISQPDGRMVPIENKRVDAHFFDVFGLRPRAGRFFARPLESCVVLNAEAALALGYAAPEVAVGRMLDAGKRIVGIAPDLRFTTLRQRPGPIMYELDDDQGVLTVRVRGSLVEARTAIEALWAHRFPNDVPDIETATSVFARNYDEDVRQAKLLTLASTVATALACFGIYVLSSYSVRRRAREIVLRKLHGASGFDVGLLVAREWLFLLLAGAALAAVPVWLWSAHYLAPFTERAPMGCWPLLLAMAFVGAVGLAACARQAWAAMRMAPALALRM